MKYSFRIKYGHIVIQERHYPGITYYYDKWKFVKEKIFLRLEQRYLKWKFYKRAGEQSHG